MNQQGFFWLQKSTTSPENCPQCLDGDIFNQMEQLLALSCVTAEWCLMELSRLLSVAPRSNNEYLQQGNSVVTDVQFGHLFLVCIKYDALQEVSYGLFRKISHCS